MKTYEIQVGGITHTVQLSEDTANSIGARLVEQEKSKPAANKSRKPVNKSRKGARNKEGNTDELSSDSETD